MRKVYDLDSHFATGESTVQPVLLWTPSGRPSWEGFSKTASEATDYIKGVEPKPGMSIVLVLALGAYETYDLNRNGDGFNEFPYKVGMKPSCGCCTAEDGWVSHSEVLPQHYKSFEQFGKVYRHHQNKDPLKSYGDVLKAFWNPPMHRVELLIALDNAKAPDLADRIASGEYPAVSMGCRIKYDVCTICGHRAPTRAQYCDHLKFGMRQVASTGLRAGALNPSPKFFDISFVIKPADQTGYMLKKVAEETAFSIRTSAEAGEYLDRVEEKRAAIQKVSDIDKVVRGVTVDHKTSPLSAQEAMLIRQYQNQVMPAVRRMPVMDDHTITQLAKYPVSDTLSTFGADGMMLTGAEFTRLMMQKMTPGTSVPPEALDAVTALQGPVMELLAQHPQLLDQLVNEAGLELNAQRVNPEIRGVAQKYVEKRATIGDYLSRRLIPPSYRDEEPPMTDLLHVTDPATGGKYQTTRGAAIAAHDEVAKKQLAKMLGGSAALLGAYKVLSSGLPAAARPLAAGTAALAGAKFLPPDYGPQYMTDEGLPVSSMTEMKKLSNDLSRVGLPLLGSAALVTGLSHDYESRLRDGSYFDSQKPMQRQLVDRLGQYSAEHPALALLGSLSAYGLGRAALNKLGSLNSTDHSDSVLLPEMDFDKVAEILGEFILA
jgi:hypothetical protein